MSRLGPQWDTHSFNNSVSLGLAMLKECGLTPQRMREMFPPNPPEERVTAERSSLADKYREAHDRAQEGRRERQRQGYIEERAE